MALLRRPPGCESSYSSPVIQPADNKMHTRPEPNIRGTFRLIVSCVVTLALCVYTALHLNVPQQGIPAYSMYLRKARWVLMGMFAPELVVYAAWKQWHDAKETTAIINKVFEKVRFISIKVYDLSRYYYPPS